jgi:hypothetical protein
MKFTALFFSVVAFGSTTHAYDDDVPGFLRGLQGVVLDSCYKQAQCFDFTVTPVTTDCSDACQFKVCMRFNGQGLAVCKTTVSHICLPSTENNQCTNQLASGNFKDETVTDAEYCTVAGPNELVPIVVKDGSQCATRVNVVYNTNGYRWQCSSNVQTGTPDSYVSSTFSFCRKRDPTASLLILFLL